MFDSVEIHRADLNGLDVRAAIDFEVSVSMSSMSKGKGTLTIEIPQVKKEFGGTEHLLEIQLKDVPDPQYSLDLTS